MVLDVGVMGASGFAGAELVRILLRHPHVNLKAVTSVEHAGLPLSHLYPAFEGGSALSFVAHDDPVLSECAVVFLAVPHTAALNAAPQLVERGAVVIDLSADFRLDSADAYQQWYGVSHGRSDLLAMRAFGLPELFVQGLRDQADRFRRSQGCLVACAGCYPTATSLAAAPALRSGLVGEGIVVADAVSGVTGAGRRATDAAHFCAANESLRAYGVGSHRHLPEIEQILGLGGRLVFTPHLAPLSRGLLSTVTLPLATDEAIDAARLQRAYESFYRTSAFVSVLPAGVQPRTSDVVGTNRAQVAVALHPQARAIVATCAIDNLGKGAAGQAVQCANIVCGLPETAGLDLISTPA
ncbi:N-acetyl-gamma-glutamyl-phosphate reductase [Eggerthellaceae bacterium zg-1084]|uniref:N-acetyl-gamma-glutamyl-phosphate reductase n=1 Tax=Berryella wangjianweii TaxID=2734634 RepID=UPI001554624B|nr:N-acetyl-gamma-glutamyl-phosphate reductase [Berryella wangjianweii]NPD30812.1 N-acetyl-gamma-glutamyl-phosphate reductase [Berryella wangjianweii]